MARPCLVGVSKRNIRRLIRKMNRALKSGTLSFESHRDEFLRLAVDDAADEAVACYNEFMVSLYYYDVIRKSKTDDDELKALFVSVHKGICDYIDGTGKPLKCRNPFALSIFIKPLSSYLSDGLVRDVIGAAAIIGRAELGLPCESARLMEEEYSFVNLDDNCREELQNEIDKVRGNCLRYDMNFFNRRYGGTELGYMLNRLIYLGALLRAIWSSWNSLEEAHFAEVDALRQRAYDAVKRNDDTFGARYMLHLLCAKVTKASTSSFLYKCADDTRIIEKAFDARYEPYSDSEEEEDANNDNDGSESDTDSESDSDTENDRRSGSERDRRVAKEREPDAGELEYDFGDLFGSDGLNDVNNLLKNITITPKRILSDTAYRLRGLADDHDKRHEERPDAGRADAKPSGKDGETSRYTLADTSDLYKIANVPIPPSPEEGGEFLNEPFEGRPDRRTQLDNDIDQMNIRPLSSAVQPKIVTFAHPEPSKAVTFSPPKINLPLTASPFSVLRKTDAPAGQGDVRRVETPEPSSADDFSLISESEAPDAESDVPAEAPDSSKAIDDIVGKLQQM
ncbi:GP32 [Caviid betaherpesvirus 2]|uniref:GP32 n=3 Tax=Caviid betaherpesvirus 2 TaxID=33706 RepID=U6H8B5_9BETA|nr:GP32 [Caviid betaherpesvirus 2]AGE11510.1 GP32 [Caviid betaherpesvirus 2]AIL83898.1 GP32 [BAC cloning vector GPN13BACdenovo_preserved(MM)]BAJ78500.1 GP32 [Caviid betaherpesvirus 2]CDI95376.1 GP32 [Caviid herpesvirus 2 str. CIDMTR]